MTSDVFSHPWLGGLFADAEIAACLDAEATLAHMIAVEAAYARALGEAGLIDAGFTEAAAVAIEGCAIDMELLRDGTAKDGVVVPALVRSIKAQVPADLHGAIHKGLTSQDVIDTSLILSLKSAVGIMDRRLAALEEELERLMARFGDHRMMARTRMQAAVEINAADRIRAWQAPLSDHRARLFELSTRLLCCQLGGAAGDRGHWGDASDAVSAAMAAKLLLRATPQSWHSQRAGIAEFAGWLSLVTGSLGKMGQDVVLMAQQGIEDIQLAGGGGSSAMPHKQNPVQAELLVTLSQFNATQLSGMHLAMVHEQERSGAAWSLEWMILPQMLMATGTAMGKALAILASVERIGRPASG